MLIGTCMCSLHLCSHAPTYVPNGSKADLGVWEGEGSRGLNRTFFTSYLGYNNKRITKRPTIMTVAYELKEYIKETK